MTLSAATLGGELEDISGASEAAAITAWTAAWATYFAGAVAGSQAFTGDAGQIATARSLMGDAMSGLSVSGQADDKVQAGIIAWWDRLVAAPGSYFSGATSITKPANLTSIAAALPAIFADNKDGALSSAAACSAIATSIHGNNAGGSSDLGGIT